MPNRNKKLDFSSFGYRPNRAGGFTLVELILYVGLAAAMVLAISIFFSAILKARVEAQVISEVEGQGIQVMQKILQTIRNADAVSFPSQGFSGSFLSLDVPDNILSPTVFDISVGAIRVAKGAASPIKLTSSRVVASDLSFRNLARTGAPGAIRVEFTLSYLNQEGLPEYDYSRIFTGSAVLRSY